VTGRGEEGRNTQFWRGRNRTLGRRRNKWKL